MHIEHMTFRKENELQRELSGLYKQRAIAKSYSKITWLRKKQKQLQKKMVEKQQSNHNNA